MHYKVDIAQLPRMPGGVFPRDIWGFICERRHYIIFLCRCDVGGTVFDIFSSHAYASVALEGRSGVPFRGLEIIF